MKSATGHSCSADGSSVRLRILCRAMTVSAMLLLSCKTEKPHSSFCDNPFFNNSQAYPGRILLFVLDACRNADGSVNPDSTISLIERKLEQRNHGSDEAQKALHAFEGLGSRHRDRSVQLPPVIFMDPTQRDKLREALFQRSWEAIAVYSDTATIRSSELDPAVRRSGIPPRMATCIPLYEKRVFDIGKGAFREFVDGRDIVIVDFWAPWCSPCLQFKPHFENASRMIAGAADSTGRFLTIDFASVNTDEIDPHDVDLASLGMKGIPTCLMFRKGKQICEVNTIAEALEFREAVSTRLGQIGISLR